MDSSTTHNKPVILVVDDIYTNRFLLKEIISSANMQCLLAENGKQAIDIFAKTQIDLVLMDIEMPIMNGLDTVLYIRNNFMPPRSTPPIIALTAHNSQMFFNDFSEVKFDDILTKPYSPQRVLQMIQRFLQTN